ncbi:MAG: dipeptidase [Oscillospiraceae bacterium]|jgi:Zn-dependent dipeptidase, microsomal dipeptidase homolog|nr:dipeptidase [Oscillospiraceae bacterium]MBQ1705473.1 dipeptidase [Clostridia bacterium]
MKSFNIVDLHCDTLMEVYLKGHTLENAPGHINLEKLRAGGSQVQCFAVFIPTHDCAQRYGVTESAYDYFTHCADAFDRQMALYADVIRPVRCVADIEQNVKDGKLSAMLTIEDGVAVDGKLERLQEFYDRGVRMIALTWNYENSIGYPNSRDPQEHMRPLKPFGIEAIAKMDELGMIVDVSHLSEGGFWDVVKHGKKPFIASHSCARALSDHRRNLTDEQLRALGEKGGVCGVNFCDAFLRLDSDMTTVDDIVRHAIHIADKAGIDAVAMGSDFDGIGDNLEFKDFAGFPMIVDGLAKRFSSADVDKICHGNALRVFKDVIG